MNKRYLASGGAALVVLAAIGFWSLGGDGPADKTPADAAASDPGTLTAAQVEKLGIRLEPARDSGALPLGSVPGQVSLPPEARVAVTTPFAGTAVRVLVMQGQQVTQGQTLAIVRSAEPVQFGAELARAEADLAFSRTQAQRLGQLAKEGIVAGVRADEAQATLRRTEATIRENRRLLSLAGAGGDGMVTLRAPIAGRVASVAIDTGGAVGGGIAPFVIENSAALVLDLQLPERLAGQVRPGMAVDVVLPPPAGGQADASPVTVTGRILSVAPSLDPVTRSVAAKASIGSAPGLVPGKGVMAVISGTGERSGVSVPSQAVTRIESHDYVFVRSGQRFQRRQVVVAADVGGRAVLSDGLKSGEAVAVSGIAELKAMLAGQ